MNQPFCSPIKALRSVLDAAYILLRRLSFTPSERSGKNVYDFLSAIAKHYEPMHSDEGDEMISPVEFIPLLEKSRLIIPVGEFVRRRHFA